MCWLKSSLESKTSPKCFCEDLDCILLLLKVKGGGETFSRLCEKHTSLAFFIGSGLNKIFHWYNQCLISFKPLFSLISECFLAMALEKSDVSPANILHNKFIPSGKSFIFIRNNNGPKTNPCGTPIEMFFHEDVCSFKTTLCCRSFQNFDELE